MRHLRLLAPFPFLVSSLCLAQLPVSFELNQNCTKLNLCGITYATTTAQGDFNNDGKPDLLTGDGIVVSLRLGRGDGTFEAPVQIGSTHQSTFVSLLAVDLNGDGILDLVASSYNSATVDVLFGKGDGTFGPTINFPLKKPLTFGGIAAGDFNGDGHVELAAADSSGNIEIFQETSNSTGNGSFALAKTVTATPGTFAVSLSAGDVDGDGKADLVVTDTTKKLYVLWAVGGYNFNQVLLNTYPQGKFGGSTYATIGDVNQDGSADILVSYNYIPNTAPPAGGGEPGGTGIDVYYGGQGRQTTFFRNAIIDGEVSFVEQLMSVDVDGDGLADLVGTGVMPDSEQGLVVWTAERDGSFSQAGQPIITGRNGVTSLVAGDFNRDGMMDFSQVVNGDSVVLYTNATDRAPCLPSLISPTVTICQPVDNTYVPGPAVNILATAYDKTTVTALQEYADGQLVYSQPVTGFNIALPEGLGSHLLVTKAWDANGVSFRSNRHVTVYSGTPGAVCPAAPASASLCLPSGATASSPVHILGNGATHSNGASSAVPTAAQLYVDGSLVVNDTSGSTVIDVMQPLTAGTHDLVFKLWDENGFMYTASKNVSVQ